MSQDVRFSSESKMVSEQEEKRRQITSWKEKLQAIFFSLENQSSLYLHCGIMAVRNEEEEEEVGERRREIQNKRREAGTRGGRRKADTVMAAASFWWQGVETVKI